MDHPLPENLLEAIKAIQQLFSCRICCHDFSGQIIAIFGKDNLPMEHTNDICKEIKGSDETFFQRCLYCDVKAAHGLSNNKPILKRCHAGIYELVVPILRFRNPIGLLFAGPFSCSDQSKLSSILYLQPENSKLLQKTVAKVAFLPEISNEKLNLIRPLLLLITEKITNIIEGQIAKNEGSRRERMRFFFKQRHMSQINENDLAEFLELSITRVSQLLNEYFGKSFSEMLNETRLEFAENALINSVSPIERIAELSGFGTTAYFYRVFKNKNHMTPAQFRQQKISAPIVHTKKKSPKNSGG